MYGRCACFTADIHVSFKNNHSILCKDAPADKNRCALNHHTSWITRPLTLPPLTLCTARPFVADGAHAVAISAGAVAAAKRVDALRDGDITLGSFPAAVTHTGALVVLAVATAQHRACRWRKRRRGRRREIKPCAQKENKQLSSFF